MSKARAWRSSFGGPTIKWIACRNWRPIWCGAGWPLSPPHSARRLRSPPRLPPRAFRSCSASAPIRVQAGLVPSFNRPGGNVTGIVLLNWELGAKRFGLLHQLLPRAARFAVLVRPDNPDVVEPFIKEVEMA